jgi:hypothetical protein
MTRTETWRVESWDEGNHEPAQFNRSAGWVPAGHLLHSEAEARAWAGHLHPVAAPLRIIHRTIEEEVIDL